MFKSLIVTNYLRISDLSSSGIAHAWIGVCVCVYVSARVFACMPSCCMWKDGRGLETKFNDYIPRTMSQRMRTNRRTVGIDPTISLSKETREAVACWAIYRLKRPTRMSESFKANKQSEQYKLGKNSLASLHFVLKLRSHSQDDWHLNSSAEKSGKFWPI